MIGDETGQHGIDILIEFVFFTLNIAFINIYQYIIYHKNINAKSFTHSFFKHYPEVRSQYFGFVMGLTEVNNNKNTQWSKIKQMLWGETKKSVKVLVLTTMAIKMRCA